MRDDQYNGTGRRIQKRKRKTADKILNISLGVVVLLILLVGGQLLLGGKSSDPVVSDNIDENESSNTNETGETEGTSDDPTETNADKSTAEVGQEDDPATEATQGVETQDEETRNDSSSQTETEQPTSNGTSRTGQWEPIGTVQEEPFAAVYEKDHINWEEMTKAFQYATGLGNDMTLWHVGNGGDHKSAVGVVADASTRTTPFHVRIEWVTNEGWMPVSVVQLEENKYISRYSSTTEETDDNDE